jgi:HPt (histidine-containing phosphotransfer) domain-containing protein
VLLRGDHTPRAADCVLRWPVSGEALYRALDSLCTARAKTKADNPAPAAIDALTFSTLEKSVGLKTLIEILHCYEATAEQLTNALAKACAEEKWDEAARLAHDIVGAAGGLGLTAMTQAARHFAQAARNGEDGHVLRNAAQIVVGEHVRARKALVNLYPDLR